MVGGLGELAPVSWSAGQEATWRTSSRTWSRSATRGSSWSSSAARSRCGAGILDVFPPTEEHPLRVEFWGDEVEEIRYFKAADQRSLAVAPRRPVGAAVPRAAADPGGPRPGPAAGRRVARPGRHARQDGRGHHRRGHGGARAGADRPDGAAARTTCRRGGIVVACDPERIRARAADLVATSQEFLEASWVSAAAGGEVPIDLGGAAFRADHRGPGVGHRSGHAVVDDHPVRRHRHP